MGLSVERVGQSIPKLKKKVIIVGAGLAGLACANRLAEHGVSPLIVEGSDGVGGRVRTDTDGGFLLDRGFQVYLDAYPQAGKLLDLAELDLRRFKPGALVFKGGRMRRMMDPFRCPLGALRTAIQPIGNLRDKLLVGKLRLRAQFRDLDDIAARPDQTTEQHLRETGFSDAMIDGFFRPFYGGIFLERELATSSRMFEFTFKMFAKGFATLPAGGMGAIPQQLAGRLPEGTLRLNSPAHSVGGGAVTLENGERLTGDAVVVATDAQAAQKLLPSLGPRDTAWRSVTAVYFSAPESPLGEAIIALNGEPDGLINNVSVPSDVSPSYAPAGKALISVSVLGVQQTAGFEAALLAELRSWFGAQVDAWQPLRTFSIRKGLPAQPPSNTAAGDSAHRVVDGVYVCGDHCASASIEGALVSGKSTAEAIIESFC